MRDKSALEVVAVVLVLALAIALYTLGAFIGADEEPSDIPQAQGEKSK